MSSRGTQNRIFGGEAENPPSNDAVRLPPSGANLGGCRDRPPRRPGSSIPTMIPLILLSYALLLLPLAAHGTTIKYCDRAVDYAVKVKDVKIYPDPVVPGKPTTFDIYASSGQALPKGKVVIKVLYHGILLRTETHDICEEMSCPIASGDFTLSHTQNLPAFTPPGLYTLKITMEDEESSQQLTCISFNFRIRFGSLASVDS